MEAIVESLQRSAGNAAVGQLLARDAMPRVDAAAGDGLSPSVKAAAERRLGADLSDVRVHADASAETYASSLGAEAVTVGRDVFLGAGASETDSSHGRQTLMHELAHTVQSSGGDARIRGVSNPTNESEREATSIGATGLYGAAAPPTQLAPAGIAHRKIADEEETKEDEPQAAAEPMPDFLNPEPLPETEAGPAPPKPGESGEAESVAYEITVMQPLRAAVMAVESQDWEAALAALQSVGMKLLDYQQVYEKKNPLLYAEFMSARGWLATAYAQLNRRLDRDLWSDDKITSQIRDFVGEFQMLETKL